jgi:hypothetical protein
VTWIRLNQWGYLALLFDGNYTHSSARRIAPGASCCYQTNPGGTITSDGDHVWATDTNFYSYRGWVAELSTRTGGLARVIGARTGHVERS